MDRKLKACLPVFLLAAVVVTCAQPRTTFSSSPPSGPLHSLADAKIFALGPVGFSGTHSQEELLFKELFTLGRDKALRELGRFYSSGNPQAMSFALVGIRKLDPKRYSELLVQARASDVTVTTMWGCAIENEKLRMIANDLDAGKYDPWLRWMATPSK